MIRVIQVVEYIQLYFYLFLLLSIEIEYFFVELFYNNSYIAVCDFSSLGFVEYHSLFYFLKEKLIDLNFVRVSF